MNAQQRRTACRTRFRNYHKAEFGTPAFVEALGRLRVSDMVKLGIRAELRLRTTVYENLEKYHGPYEAPHETQSASQATTTQDGV